MRLALLERHVDALLTLGRHLEAIPLLEATVAEHSLDERFWAQLVLAYYRARRVDAMRSLTKIRELLATELGLSVGPELQELELRIVDHDPTLRAPADDPAPRVGSTGVVTFMLTDIVGSTERWDTQPAAMAAAVARHEQLVAEAVGQANGRVMKSRWARGTPCSPRSIARRTASPQQWR